MYEALEILRGEDPGFDILFDGHAVWAAGHQGNLRSNDELKLEAHGMEGRGGLRVLYDEIGQGL